MVVYNDNQIKDAIFCGLVPTDEKYDKNIPCNIDQIIEKVMRYSPDILSKSKVEETLDSLLMKEYIDTSEDGESVFVTDKGIKNYSITYDNLSSDLQWVSYGLSQILYESTTLNL